MRLLLIALTAMISACEPYTKELHPEMLPEGLSDCAFFEVRPVAGARELYVVRCPTSTTSVEWEVKTGKTYRHINSVTVSL